MIPFSQRGGGSFTREDHRAAALSSGSHRHRKTREGAETGRYTNCWNEGSRERTVLMARERHKSPACCPLVVRQPTFLASPPQTWSSFPVRRSMGIWTKRRKGRKTGSRFRCVVDVGGAFRAGAAPGLFTAVNEGSAVLFCAWRGGGVLGIVSCLVWYSSSCPEEVFGNSLSLPGYDRL